MHDEIGDSLRVIPEGKRLLFVVNVGWFFLSHRLPIALAARNAGYAVHVACGIEAPAEEVAIRGHGLQFHRLSIHRGSRSPLGDLRLVLELLSLYRRLRPDVIHHVSIKPVIYGGLVARLTFDGIVVSAISGLGYVFTATGIRAALSRAFIRLAYLAALSGRRTKVIFQNRDDLASFVRRRLVPEKNAVLIRGSGVDLAAFRPSPEPPGPITVVLPARMLRDKGVFEFLDAAMLLRRRGVAARFVLAGRIDRHNLAAIEEKVLARAAGAAGVEWMGHHLDMPQLFASSHIVCLPSYREGMPKALLEAAAAGRPIVASDVPGCREIVVHGMSGLLVPARDSGALAEALGRLIADAALRARLGAAGRQLCEMEFGVETVVRQTLALYNHRSPAASRE